jgi:hypothetical protein
MKGREKMKRLSAFLLALAIVLGSPLMGVAATWHYDFDTGEDISGLTVVNPTGLTYPLTGGALQMIIPSRSGGWGGYDLCDWNNRYALRFRRAGGNEDFTLETSISTTYSGGTFLSGLYLFSNNSNNNDDLVFGVNSSAVKIDRGSAQQTGMPGWSSIGVYDELYLQVVKTGSTHDFKYKKSASDDWSTFWTTSAFSFDQVGIFTKTWGPSYGAASPTVTADFDYLYYNYDPVPIPGAVWLLGSGLIGLAGFRRKFKK